MKRISTATSRRATTARWSRHRSRAAAVRSRERRWHRVGWRRHVLQPHRRYGRDDHAGILGRRPDVSRKRPDRRQPGRGQPVGDPHPTVIDGNGRQSVCDPDRDRRRGSVRQPRDGRQQHGDYGIARERQRHASRERRWSPSSGGIATFSNLTDDTAETITLRIHERRPDFTAQAARSSSAPAGQPSWSSRRNLADGNGRQSVCHQPIVIDEEDQYGNLETGDNSTVVTASLASGNGTLQGTTNGDRVGRHRDVRRPHRQHGRDITLNFAGDGLTSAPSVPIVVSPAAASQLVIHTQPSSTATAGQPFATAARGL